MMVQEREKHRFAVQLWTQAYILSACGADCLPSCFADVGGDRGAQVLLENTYSDGPWNRLTTFHTEVVEEILLRVVEQIVHVPALQVLKGRIERGSLSENLSKFLQQLDSDSACPSFMLFCVGFAHATLGSRQSKKI